MRTVTHPEYQQHYDEGYEVGLKNLDKVGFEKARDLINEKFPVGQKVEGMDTY